jgi:hypothetical protein
VAYYRAGRYLAGACANVAFSGSAAALTAAAVVLRKSRRYTPGGCDFSGMRSLFD